MTDGIGGTDQPERAATIGEYLVGVDFNPSGNAAVAQIKAQAAALIDLIDYAEGDQRCKEKAVSAVEDGAMWAVKAIFRAPPPSVPDEPPVENDA